MQNERLHPSDVDYLLRNLDLGAGLRTRLEAFGQGGADLSIEDRDELRELVADRLMMVGFDADYNPTQEGLMLEKFIDLLLTGEPEDNEGAR